MLLTSDSPTIEHPHDINIKLKNHQLAMIKRCLDIENQNEAQFGIMNDKPGTGKTYAIISLIYLDILKRIENSEQNEKKTNIIIVPQNIYTQWTTSIEKFGGNIKYAKYINYSDVIFLYMEQNNLSQYDIILTTSSYYNLIATTISSLNIKVNRVFFDEIDSIANLVCSKINADFIWFISASFNLQYLGYYGNKIDQNNLDNIICKCDNDFIDENIYLETPIKKYYLCQNIYVDKILGDVLSNKEMKRLNALDFTLNNKSFEKNKVSNEKEVINLIVKNRKAIVEFEKMQIKECTKMLEHYNECLKNSDIYINDYKLKINMMDELFNFKKDLLNYISDFEINIQSNNFNIKKTELISIKNMLNDILDCFYNMGGDIRDVFYHHLNNNKNSVRIDMILMNLKKIDIIINSILYNYSNNKDDSIILTLMNIFEKNNNFIIDYIKNLIGDINKYIDLINSPNQIELFSKQLDISKKTVEDNEYKINLIYERLNENNCCSICYEDLNSLNNKKIYITSECCNHKICNGCIEEWYHIYKKTSCIYCNKEFTYFDNLLHYELENNNNSIINNNENNNENNNLTINNNTNCELPKSYEIYKGDKTDFLKKYILSLKYVNKKVIIFSDYSNVFNFIENECNEHGIKSIDLDKGTIQNIDIAVNEYKIGEAKILLSNSILFGCGMNFENSTDILFVHKMNEEMEKQVIGRAQRLGRKSVLNITYLEYENEIALDRKVQNFYTQEDLDEELNNYYKNKQIVNVLENISDINFENIQNNDIDETSEINASTDISHLLNNSNSNNDINIETNIETNITTENGNDVMNDLINNLPTYDSEPIDVNLEELIASLQ